MEIAVCIVVALLGLTCLAVLQYVLDAQDKKRGVIHDDLAFSMSSDAVDAYNAIRQFFTNNKDKYELESIKLCNMFNDRLVIRYRCINGSTQIDLYSIVKKEQEWQNSHSHITWRLS